MATKRKRRQWMIDDPNVPQRIGPRDLLVQLPGGDKVSVKSVFWAALHIAREERGVPAVCSSLSAGSLCYVGAIKKGFAVWRSRWIGRTDRGAGRIAGL